MALNNDNFARDAVYIYDRLLETMTGLKGHYYTLKAEGRDVVTVNDETGQYEPKKITVEYVVDGTSAADFKERLDYLSHILNLKDADITFNDEYDLFMMGDIHNLGLKEKHGTWGLGSYEIICENPLKYAKEISEVTATRTATGAQEFTIDNTGTAPTQPIIDVKPGGNNTSEVYPDTANLEFINIRNIVTDKNISIGSPYFKESTYNISVLNFNTIDITDLINTAGWTGGVSSCGILSKTDPYANRGAGLTYKALYPIRYDDPDLYDYDNPLDSNRLIYKSIGSNITNFICAYGVRMWADTIIGGGSLKLTALTTDSKETGVVIYKQAIDSFKGKVLYYVDGKVMGSDTIDLSKYSHSLGLTEEKNLMVGRIGGKSYWQYDAVNKKRPKSALIEPKSDGSYIYVPANNNVVFSRLGQVYTFKVADLPIRRFVYSRESGTDEYNYMRIGFKSNMISKTYPNLNIQITGIDLLHLSSSTLMDNWPLLTAGNIFEINPANLNLTRRVQNTSEGIYAPEYTSIYNSENSLIVDPNMIRRFQCLYYDKTSVNDPVIVAKYNVAYL